MAIWIESMFKPLFEYQSIQDVKQKAVKNRKSTYYILHTDNLEPYEKMLVQFKGKIIVGAVKGGDQLVAYRGDQEVVFQGNLNNVT